MWTLSNAALGTGFTMQGLEGCVTLPESSLRAGSDGVFPGGRCAGANTNRVQFGGSGAKSGDKGGPVRRSPTRLGLLLPISTN